MFKLFRHFCLALLLSHTWSIPDCSADPVRLGLSAPLSGGGAGWGIDIKNVLAFANEKLAAGKYSFVIEDDRCDVKTSLSVAQKLTAIDHITEVFILCGQITIATAKVYRDLGVTVMAPLATPSRISELGVFRTGLSDKFAAGKLAAYISAHHRSVSAFTEENDYSVLFYKDFAEHSVKLGLETENLSYLAEQHDFRPQLIRLKAKKVEAIFLNTQTEQALANLVTQLNELQFFPKLYGAYMPGSETFLKIAGKLAEGMVFVDFPGAPELLTAEGKRLFEEYTARFGPLNSWSYAFPATFESFRVIHLAKESGQPVESFLRKTAFEGIIGSYRFDDHGDIVGPQHVLRVIRNSRSEILSDPAPAR